MIPTSAQHPSLHHCRRLFLRNFEVNMNIGVHDFEKQGEQRVIVNVDLYVPLENNTPQSDDLAEVVDYDFMRQTIADIIGDYRAFAAQQRDRLLGRGIDIAPYALSHIAVRVADWALRRPGDLGVDGPLPAPVRTGAPASRAPRT